MSNPKSLCLWFILPVLFSSAASGEKRYPVSAIPPSLLPADEVVRNNTTVFTIRGIDKAILTRTYAVTVFSKKEEDAGVLLLWYDQFNDIEELEGTVYDAEGNEIKTLDDEDIKDFPGYGGNTLHSDERIKIASLYHNTFPYTVEFTYEVELTGSLNWPSWFAQHSKYPVERTSFTVVCPEEMPIRFWCNADSIHPAITVDDGQRTYEWSASLLTLLDEDAIGRDFSEITTVVRIAPSEFQMDRQKGSMQSWSEFGQWMYSLYKGRNVLPPPAVEEIRSVARTAGSEREKIKKLYEYMQAKTRYISIQLGIGGWQPFDAAFVHAKSYGDCKALTNYMSALLAVENIPSYPVVIRAGANQQRLISEFPSNQFNHVILCVPQKTDTVWLECTSQSMPFGRLSDFTESREALLISPDGGVIVRTPSSHAGDNVQKREATITITAAGHAVAAITTTFSGNQQSDIQNALIEKSSEERERWIMERMKMPHVAIADFSIAGLENRSPEIAITVSASLARYAAANGERIFFNPNLQERRTYVPPPVKKRLSSVRLAYAYEDIDSMYYRLPKGYMPEAIPKPITLQAFYASYRSETISLGDTAIVFTRKIAVHQPTIPAARYDEYRMFWSDVAASDRAQVVLKRKE